jgi:hypothetical protein
MSAVLGWSLQSTAVIFVLSALSCDRFHTLFPCRKRVFHALYRPVRLYPQRIRSSRLVGGLLGRGIFIADATFGTRHDHTVDAANDEFVRPDASSTATVIISDAEADDVYAYSADKLVATITGFSEPQGLAANTAGDIYIADTVNSRVVEYKNDYKTKLATFTDANQYPAGVDIDNTTGVLGVTNIISTADGDGSVSFYAKGKTSKPCKTVTNSNWARVYFGAFGPSGNFFVDGEGVNGDVLVGEVKGECSATTITTLTTSNAIEFPGGVQVDAKGNILVDDQEGFVIYAYKAPVGTKLGAPVATTALNGAGDPVTFSLNKAETTVWTADASLVEGLAYRFPAGGSKVNSIAGPPFEQPIGVVVTPLAPN